MPVAKRGRPRLDIDLNALEKLAMLHCTDEEIAAFFQCDPSTISKRKQSDEEFFKVYKRGREKGKMSLRRLQWKSAEAGSVTMQIWLGKQHLGQRDRPDLHE